MRPPEPKVTGSNPVGRASYFNSIRTSRWVTIFRPGTFFSIASKSGLSPICMNEARPVDDFINSSVPASECVRNFSDTCRGKTSELRDIEFNRDNYTMLSASKYAIRSVSVVTPWVRGEIRASCEFHARTRKTNQTGVAAGTCSLTAVYDADRWWLCDSSFTATTRSSVFISIF